jgi:hypothetical protein
LNARRTSSQNSAASRSISYTIPSMHDEIRVLPIVLHPEFRIRYRAEASIPGDVVKDWEPGWVRDARSAETRIGFVRLVAREDAY